MNFNLPLASRGRMTVYLLAIMMLVTCGVGHSQTSLLISVTFKTNNPFGNSPLISGPDPAATLANPDFGAANVWNNLFVPWGVLAANPSWNLVDSAGQATPVTLSITGKVLPVDLWPFISNADALRSSFIAWNSWTTGLQGHDPNESKTLTWKLTGLPLKTKFDICIYGSVADVDRGFDMTLGGLIMGVPTFNADELPRPSCVVFSTISSNAKGVISGVGAGVGDSTMATNEANWSGFQLVQRSATSNPRRLGFVRSPN